MFAADAWPEEPAGPPRAWYLGLFVITLVAALLRLAALDRPLYIDEIVTLTVASQPLAAMAGVMRQIDASPALYPVLLHFWMYVGTSDAWVRLLPAVFGILAIPVCAIVTSRAFGWRAGLGAGAVMAIAPAHIHYAQYVRSYSLFTLLAAIHVWLFMQWMDSDVVPGRGLAAKLVLTTSALLYTHYLSVLLFGAEGLYALYRWRELKARALRGVLVFVVSGVLFVPGLPLLLHNVEFDRLRDGDRPDPPPVTQVAPNLLLELSVGQRILGFDNAGARRATLTAAAVVFGWLTVVGAVREWRRGRSRMVVLMALVTIAPLLVYVGSGRKLIAVRFFVPFMLGYLALLGAGLASLKRVPLFLAGGALLAVCAVPLEHYYRDFRWSYDHRVVAQEIATRSLPGDGLMVVHPYEAFFYRWYLRDRLPITGMVFTALEDQAGYVIKPPPVRFEHARLRIAGAAERHARLWVIGQSRRSFASDPHEQLRVLDWMDSEYSRVADLDHLTGGDPAIRLYELRTVKAR